MSIQAMQWAWDQATETPGEALVLLAIADHAWSDGTHAYPGVARIARMARMTEMGVQKIIRRLVDRGLVSVAQRGGGRGNCSAFKLVMHPETPNSVDPLPARKTQTGAPENPNSDRGILAETPNSAPETLNCDPSPYKVLTGTRTKLPEPTEEPSASRKRFAQGQAPGALTSAPKAKAPNRNAEVIDAFDAAAIFSYIPGGAGKALGPRDHAAIKTSPLEPSEMVRAFQIAQRLADNGDSWWAGHLSLHFVLSSYSALVALEANRGSSRQGPAELRNRPLPAPAPRAGASVGADRPTFVGHRTNLAQLYAERDAAAAGAV